MKLTEYQNLFTTDFGILFWKPKEWKPDGRPFSAKTIHRFVKLLADSGVDTLKINPNSQGEGYNNSVKIVSVELSAR